MIPLVVLLSCGGSPVDPAPGAAPVAGVEGGRAFAIVYSGNLDGEIEPCG